MREKTIDRNDGFNEDLIQERLHLHQIQPVIPPENMRWRRAAVLVPLAWVEDDWQLLYILRTHTVADHKGQVAFPGGSMDPEDATLEQTALREAFEEVGLIPDQVRLLGRLPDFYTNTNYLITPIVGVIPWPFELKLSYDEVSRVYTIPLQWLANPGNHEVRPFAGSDGYHEHVIFFKSYDGEVLWGATARITLTFLEILGLA